MNVAVIDKKTGALRDLGPTYESTLARKHEVVVVAATTAAAAKGLSGDDLLAEVAKKIGTNKITNEEMKQIGGLIAASALSSAELVAVERWMYGKNSATEAQLAAFAATSGIPILKLRSAIEKRGFKVTP
jgi:hypothetical protein